MEDTFARFLSDSLAGLDLGAFGQRHSNTDLRKLHDRALEVQTDTIRKCRSQNVLLTTIGVAKPTRQNVASAMASCTPILVSDLHLGSTHKGRLLRGTIPVGSI